MKFKKYVAESAATGNKLNLNITEEYTHPDSILPGFEMNQQIYGPIRKMIEEGKFDEARAEIADLEKDLEDIKATNAKRRFFKYPNFMIKGMELNIQNLKDKLPKNESIDDMDKRCERCNTLLNDGGTCPKCDDGEEDYGEDDKTEVVAEELSVREKLKAAYPELNFDVKPVEEVTESVEVSEELSNKEKLKRAFPELNFDSTVTENMQDSTISEDLSVREKLKAAYPELNFDEPKEVTEEVCSDCNQKVENDINTPEVEEPVHEGCRKSQLEDIEVDIDEYDDDYEMDDVEQDRRHAALYGGDRMYCDCGQKLSYDDDGYTYCPDCERKEPEVIYDDEI